MNKELEILQLADYSEHFEYNGAQAYLIVNRKMNDYQCMFGFCELPDDADAASVLFQRIEDKARELGFSHIVGPVNYCTWMSYRWAISNFETKLFPDCDNPPYYNDIITKLGYAPLYTYRSACIDIANPLYFAGEAIYREKLQEGYEFRKYEGDEAYQLAEEVYSISKDAFADAYLYSDIPYEYFERLYLSWTRQLKLIMYGAFHNGRLIGYVMGYDSPDGKMFISKTSAVLKEYQKHKIYTALMYLGCRYVLDKGYKDMMYHFQCEQKSTFRRFDSNIETNEKRYAVYVKKL